MAKIRQSAYHITADHRTRWAACHQCYSLLIIRSWVQWNQPRKWFRLFVLHFPLTYRLKIQTTGSSYDPSKVCDVQDRLSWILKKFLSFFWKKWKFEKNHGTRLIGPVHRRLRGDSIRIPLLRCPSDAMLENVRERKYGISWLVSL